MKIERAWAMPSRWTFTIKPIKKFIHEEMHDGEQWADPFAGLNSPAQIRNDLNPLAIAEFHFEALPFLKSMPSDSCDGVFFDPPYSPRQVKECYQGIGLKTVADNTRQDFWSKCKDEISRITRKGGKVLCFGWNSMGMSKSRGFEMYRILLVPHGGAKNDTICTAEIKL